MAHVQGRAMRKPGCKANTLLVTFILKSGPDTSVVCANGAVTGAEVGVVCRHVRTRPVVLNPRLKRSRCQQMYECIDVYVIPRDPRVSDVLPCNHLLKKIRHGQHCLNTKETVGTSRQLMWRRSFFLYQLVCLRVFLTIFLKSYRVGFFSWTRYPLLSEPPDRVNIHVVWIRWDKYCLCVCLRAYVYQQAFIIYKCMKL